MRECSKHRVVLQRVTLNGVTLLRCPIPECPYVRALKLYNPDGSRKRGNKKPRSAPRAHARLSRDSENNKP